MYSIRCIDGTPHFVCGGMHNETREKSSMSFWRNGVHFTVLVNGPDVQADARFYQTWRPMIRDNSLEVGMLHQNATVTFDALCDCIISQSMPSLQQLAPTRPYWQTLRDFLCGSSYTMKLVATTGRAAATICDGPDDKAAYNLQPRTTDISPFEHLPHHDSGEIVVLDYPHKVRAPDTEEYTFKGFESDSRDADTGELSNHSLDSISTLLALETMAKEDERPYPPGIIRPAAIITHPYGLENTETPKVAGLLFPRQPENETLADIVQRGSAATKDQIFSESLRWRKQVEETLDCLHSRQIYCEREGWRTINMETISVGGDMTWLRLVAPVRESFADGRSGSDNKADMDFEAVAQVFDSWLPKQLAALAPSSEITESGSFSTVT